MSAAYVGAWVDRPGGVLVLVPLLAPGPTVFVEPDHPRPSQAWLVLHRRGEDDALPRVSANEVALGDVMGCFWPAGAARVDARLRATECIDNRLDMETALQAWADLIDATVAWWAGIDERLRTPVLRRLRARDPVLSGILSSTVPPLATTIGARTGQAIGHLEAQFFLVPPAPEPAFDEEAWRAWSARTLDATFGRTGGLRQLMGDAYEERPGQMDMAEHIERTLEHRGIAMVEAGTGIGKSLAYLMPALRHGAREEERVIVSTYTKALQVQLMTQDLPMLARLGYPGRARLLLGRNNYLCRRQLRRALAAQPANVEAARAQLALALWSWQSREGQRAELTEHPRFEPYWKSYFESVEPCSPHICHPEPACFVVRARRIAREAPVVVVNHSLLMMDLQAGQTLMGPARLLVVDEAHQLPDVATRALSLRLTRDRLEVYRNLTGDRLRPDELREVLQFLAREAIRVGEDAVARTAQRTDAELETFLNDYLQWFEKLEDMARDRLGDSHARPGEHRIHDGDEAFGAVRPSRDRMLAAAARLEQCLLSLLDGAEALEEHGCDVTDPREGLVSLQEFHRDYVEAIRFCLAAADEDWVYWLDWAGEMGLDAVVAAPLTVAAPLAELWERHFQAIVMTSATLAVGEDFSAFAEASGLHGVRRRVTQLQVPSPFYHDDQALLLTSLGLPSPDDPPFPQLVASIIADIARDEPTKILVLSTSYRLIDQIAAGLAQALPHAGEDLFPADPDVAPVRLLVQRPGANLDALSQAFRRARAAVLLATGSFWEGVDFPGRELEVLVIPRLPFAVPTEPIVEGRFERARRRGRDPFTEVALADAVLRLKQGVGRLLRSHEDRGAVLLLDQRMQTKAYGVSFLQSLPRTCELVPEVAQLAPKVIRFLREGRKQAKATRAG